MKGPFSRLLPLLVAFCLIPSAARAQAPYRTANFFVTAPTPAIAKSVGDWAEHYRKEKAVAWLGREMPAWPAPCPIKVKVTASNGGGATSFAFDRGHVLDRSMSIEGRTDRILAAVLPHEITHTVFAQRFARPLPRWADEGGASLSEDAQELDRLDRECRALLNAGKAIPLRRLFSMMDYPTDRKGQLDGERIMALYAQGASVAGFLVRTGGRPQFL